MSNSPSSFNLQRPFIILGIIGLSLVAAANVAEKYLGRTDTLDRESLSSQIEQIRVDLNQFETRVIEQHQELTDKDTLILKQTNELKTLRDKLRKMSVIVELSTKIKKQELRVTQLRSKLTQFSEKSGIVYFDSSSGSTHNVDSYQSSASFTKFSTLKQEYENANDTLNSLKSSATLNDFIDSAPH